MSAARRIAVLALLAALLGGCASPGGGAAAHNDVARCAAALPLARDVVHGQGTLVVVRPVNRADVDALSRAAGVAPPPPPPRPTTPHPHPTPQAGPPPPPKACLVVYRGDYPPGAIPAALPPATSGHYALIVLGVRHPSVYRVLVTPDLPAAAKQSWWHF